MLESSKRQHIDGKSASQHGAACKWHSCANNNGTNVTGEPCVLGVLHGQSIAWLLSSAGEGCVMTGCLSSICIRIG